MLKPDRLQLIRCAASNLKPASTAQAERIRELERAGYTVPRGQTGLTIWNFGGAGYDGVSAFKQMQARMAAGDNSAE
jgi:hypothetical protein